MSDQGSAAGNNSSDFVRKLYKMLEDPSYESVVRWGNEGDSFVVLENEKFTKSILPKHFKHSNFASFVRQLNKYDFHKVRHNNEENGQSPYGPNAWEFKHPDFRANNKDALDNIRRKAPVPRKPNQAGGEEFLPAQQVDMLNTQLVATQQQLQQLQERYNELGMHHSMLLQEVVGLNKTVVNHEHVIQQVMNFLHEVDAQRRRESRITNPNPFAQQGNNNAQQELLPVPEDDEPASPLQNASKLLNEVNADAILNMRNLEQMTEVTMRMNGSAQTPPSSEAAFRASHRQASREPPHSASSSTSMRYDNLDTMVYPIGQNNGIDPMFSEHVNNIPYSMPPVKAVDANTTSSGNGGAPPSAESTNKKIPFDPGWIRQPQILLVEDDPTCRRIGSRFLYAFNCAIDSALDGLEAVNKMHAGSKYDLVLMDIIMPNLDGVSACHLIRQFDSTTIVAMTSNIRSDDINMYLQHGMNDILPKPFTKEGLLALLEKHLGHLKKPPMSVDMKAPSGRVLKADDSPGKASSTTMATGNTSWHNSPSANTLNTGVSPSTSTINDAYSTSPYANMPTEMGYAAHQQQMNAAAAQQQARHRRQISDMGGPDELASQGNPKRQQVYSGQLPQMGRQ